MVERLWPHPRHKYWAILATVLDLIALLLAAVGVFLVKWFTTTEDEEFGLFDDSPYTDTETFCTQFKQTTGLAKSSEWVSKTTLFFLVGFALNALACIVLAFVFWPLICMKKFMAWVLKLAIVITILSAYIKFAGCWLVVDYMTKINKKRIADKDVCDTEVNNLPLGCIFFSFCFEMTALVALKVTTDKGIKGLAHIDRLSVEEEERVKENSVPEQRSRRSSSYHPDTTGEHIAILAKTSKSTISKQKIASSAVSTESSY